MKGDRVRVSTCFGLDASCAGHLVQVIAAPPVTRRGASQASVCSAAAGRELVRLFLRALSVYDAADIPGDDKTENNKPEPPHRRALTEPFANTQEL